MIWLKKSLLVFYFLVVTVHVSSQSIGLRELMDAAVTHHPWQGSPALFQQIMETELDRVNADLKPQLQLFGQASWQSDVTWLNLEFPSNMPFSVSDLNIPTPPQEQFKAGLDFSQRIYQGGAVKHQRSLASIDHEISVKELEIEITALKRRVSELYFHVLMMSAAHEVSESYVNDLDARIEQVQSAVSHGAVLSVSLLELEAERLSAKQRIIEIQQAEMASRSSLAELCGMGPILSSEFEAPLFDIEMGSDLRRAELDRFAMLMQRMETNRKLISAYSFPLVSGYSQTGIGRPGLNMFEETIDPYAIIGIRINWTLWDWEKRKNQGKLLGLQRKVIDNQMKGVELGIKAQLAALQHTMQQYEGILVKDDEIIEKRERISEIYGSRLLHGEITPADYLREKNAELRARMNKITHEYGLQKTRVEYLFTSGQWK